MQSLAQENLMRDVGVKWNWVQGSEQSLVGRGSGVDGWRDTIYNMPSPPAMQDECVHLDGTDSQRVAILRQLRGSHGSLRPVWLTVCLTTEDGGVVVGS